MTTIVRGIPQTKAALARVNAELLAASPAASRAGGEVLARAMMAKAPRNTGRMASGITVSIEGATAKVGSDVPYARFVEFGTRYMGAQPFEQGAADETTGGIVSAIAAVLRAAIH